MQFLIDECLHTSLVRVAHDAGHEAHHVNWQGMRGWKDHAIMRRVRTDGLTFVTNNAGDFRRLFAQEPLHAGLIILLPNVAPSLQRQLFAAVLAHIGNPGHRVVEVNVEADAIVITEYGLPQG
jgi:predicted nuclease of predicted toxin-antitoxin system